MSDVEHVAEEDINTEGESTVKSSTSRSALASTTAATRPRRCLQLLAKIAFSTPGLVVLVVSYSVLGALIFPLLEAPRELRNTAMIAKSREDCLKELWTITEKLNVLYERNWTMLVHEQLRRFEGSIVSATRNGLGGLGGESSIRWSFSEALLYSITVITTIGHGNLTPKTSGGKVVTIVYALIGVPLMLMCLSSLGSLLAEALQCTYARVRSCSARQNCENSGHGGCLEKNHEMDCNVCKYDAVGCETKLHGYEYSSVVNDRDDSRQLIRNSPTKINNTTSSTCLQINANPIIQQQQQQQHQQYILASTEGSSPLKHHLNQTHSPQHYQLVAHPNYRTILNCRGATTEGGHELTTSATTYFPIALPANHFSCNPANNYNQSPTIKYHAMQLQTPLSHVKGFASQDPHLHTATVHGIRRGKFLPKPMPQEINMLLAESDISFRSDAMSNSSEQCTNLNTNGSNVDLMEDEEENEQNRIGCPHGTPSRIPLLSSSSTSGKANGMEMESQEITRDGEGENDKNTSFENSMSPPQVPITIVLFILLSYISMGTVIFSLWENWSIIDGAYFCFVTLSTIGYGDFLPLRTFHGPDIQLFACCAYLLLGLVLVAMSFSILETQLMWKCKRIAVRLKLTKD